MMRKTFGYFVTALEILVAAALASVAAATTNYTDMWWNPAESGWGVTLSQDYNGPIFATFFVYAADSTPRWVVGVMTSNSVSGVYSGDLLETTGGAALSSQNFDPAAVQVVTLATLASRPPTQQTGRWPTRTGAHQ